VEANIKASAESPCRRPDSVPGAGRPAPGSGAFRKSLLIALAAFAVLTLARGLLLISYPHDFAVLSVLDVLRAWRDGLRFDATVVARFFGLPLLLMNLPGRWFARRRWVDSLAWVCYALLLALALLLAADLIYFREVERHVSFELTSLSSDGGFLVRALGAYPVELLSFALFALLLFAIWRRMLRAAPAAASRQLILFPLVLALVVVGIRGGAGRRVIEIIDAYPDARLSYGNLALNGAFTAMVFALNLEPVSHHFFDSRAALAGAGGAPDAPFPLLQRLPARERRPNIVFVLLESWNFQHVDSFGGHGYRATPEFDALARDGLRFTHFYAAGQRSIEGIQATLTGIPPLAGLPRIDAGVGISSFTRLGTVARKRGYSTLFVQSSDRDSFKVQGIAAAAGFEDYFGREDIPLLLSYPDPSASAFGWDYDTLQFTRARLDAMRPPFLAYVFTGTTHVPYAPLPGERKRHSRAGEDGYLATLRYADWSIGQFMRAAAARPWFRNTIFIFTADHTNAFQTGDFAERFHTPLLIYGPGWIPAGEDGAVGSQLDVLPTLLDLMGSDAPWAALGHSLLSPGEREAFVSAGGVPIGLITRQGWLVHNLSRRLAAVAFDAARAPDFGRMERKLLALDQASYELLRENRWSP
jgi:hypothetical protein